MSSIEANQRLLSDLRDCLSTYYKSNAWCSITKNELPSLLNSTYLFVTFLFFIASIPPTSENDSVNANTIIQSLIVLAVAILNILLTVTEVRTHHFWHRERSLSRLSSLFENGVCDWTSESYPSHPLCTLRSHITVKGLRDGKLVNIPHSILVNGDIIQVDLRFPSPADVRTVNMNYLCTVPEHISMGEIAQDKLPVHKGDQVMFVEDSITWYQVLETPFPKLLMQADSAVSPPSILCHQKFIVQKIINYLLIPISFIICLLFNLIRWLLFNDYFSWQESFFLWPALTVLPLISLCLQCLWTLMNAYGVAKLNCYFYNSEMDATDQRLEKLHNLMSTLVTIIKIIVWPYRYPRNELVHALGDLTAVCAVDKEYVLTGGFPTPEKVFFFNSNTEIDKKKQDDFNKDMSPSGASNECESDDAFVEQKKFSPKDDRIEITSEILDITPTYYNKSGLSFDDPYWQQYLNSLKAIGLNLIATSHTLGSNNSLLPSICSRNLQLYLYKTQCCCNLAHEIGVSKYPLNNIKLLNNVHAITNANFEFTSDSTLPKTKSRSLIQTVQDDLVQSHLVSLICHDQSRNANLLISRGSGDFIAKCCSDFWDGNDLQPMTDAERAVIIDFFTRKSLSSYCVALAYNPFFSLSATPPSVNTVGIYVPHFTMDTISHSPFFSYDDLHQRPHTPDITLSLLTNQVFVGMVSLQYHPKPDIVTLVQDLRNCGIRFIHFTVETEVRGKIFAEKLGLEAGWNCHISLSSDVCLDDNYDYFDGESLSSSSSILSSAFDTCQAYIKAKLPKGVETVRAHLHNVDNVPLLVPLFTDCSPEAVQEMMKIMQENGETILCMGNAWIVDNLPLYKQAEIGLSLLPTPDDNRESNCSTMPMIIGEDERSPLGMATILNSFTSDIQLKRDADISLHSLIIQARFVLGCIQRALLFAVGSSLMITSLLIFCVFFFLPLPLSGSHEFWLMLFVIPILSLSLLSVRDGKSKTGTLMPDRTSAVWTRNHCLYFVYFSVTYLPSSLVCFLIYWLTLENLCKVKSDFTCNPVLGNTAVSNDSSNSSNRGWQNGNEQGHVLAQDTTAFFLTLYLCVSSFMFLNRSEPIWKVYKYISWLFIVALFLVVMLQIVFFTVSQAIAISWAMNKGGMIWSLRDVPFYIWIIGTTWIILQFALQELVKLHIRNMFIRVQNKLRLAFQTKLGMNSPF